MPDEHTGSNGRRRTRSRSDARSLPTGAGIRHNRRSEIEYDRDQTDETKSASVTRRGRLVGAVKPLLQFVGFWVAVVLPVVHLGLIARGLENPGVAVTFLGLLTINFVSLYVGHGYEPDGQSERR